MLRIALVSPPYGTGSNNSMRPLGLMAICSYLERELAGQAQVELFDYSDWPETDYRLLETDGITGYDVVGLCSYSSNFPIARRWALEVKRRNPKVVTVLGGPHPTALPQHIADKHSDAFDFVVRGEGERPMVAIARALIAGDRAPRAAGVVFKALDGEVITVGTTDPVKDLNSMPTPLAKVRSPYRQTLEYFDRKESRMRVAVPFTTSRGCPFSCTFCSIRASDSKWRAVNATRLGEWIAEARALDPTIEHVSFMDADFLIDRKRVIAIGEMFATRHPGLTWNFSGRVDDLARLGEPALAVLATQGLRVVEVGFESGSQAMLDRLGKQIQVQENYDAVAMLKRLDLDMVIDFILFVPDETPAQLRESLTFLRRAGLADYLPHSHFFSHLEQYPGTPLRSYYEQQLGVKFSLDELPDPAPLFSHPGTKQIFRFFMVEFAVMARRLAKVIAKVDATAVRVRTSDPKLAQYLRIEAVSLRHLPYQVLDDLIDHHQGESLLEALPWVARYDEHLDRLEALCSEGAERHEAPALATV